MSLLTAFCRSWIARLEANETGDRVLAEMRDELVENVQRASFPFVEQLLVLRALDASVDQVKCWRASMSRR